MKLFYPFLVLSFSFSFSFSQDKGGLDLGKIFYMNFDYRIPVNKQKISNAGHGFSMELNLGFGKKKIISVFGGWLFTDKLWGNTYKKEFADDFEQNLQLGNYAGIDSAGLVQLRNDFHYLNQWALPLGSYHEGFHDRNFYYGITIMLPNKKFPIIKIYRGQTTTKGGTDYIPCPSGDYGADLGMHYLTRPLVWGASVSFCNVLWWYKKYKETELQQNVTISFYYEVNDYSKTIFTYFNGCTNTSTMNLVDITNSNFVSKYKNEVRFGFKIGFLLLQEND